ncbi:MAG: ABC transporter ATP-binding protein, partial [Cyanothece sp. SIO2G6]|nr:ABC transporter ATP-binding protein [Cyanothece sp. SIO2G6]
MLSIRRLSKAYSNGIQALCDVTLDIDYGIFGLLGPNGAGKSSLMRTLATLQEADSGAVLFNEIDLLRQPQEIRKVLGYLPQDFGVYPNVTAMELLDQLAVFKGIGNRRERQQEVRYRLEMVNLYDQRNQQLGSYSGGMLRRFGIAQALLGSPKLVIIDEPTAGLDPTERIRFQNLLADLSGDRVFILSTHIVEDIAALCPQMAIMNRGKIIRWGSPMVLLDSLRGQVWTCKVPATAAAAEAFAFDPEWTVITARMVQGDRHIRVLSESVPGKDFQAVEP